MITAIVANPSTIFGTLAYCNFKRKILKKSKMQVLKLKFYMHSVFTDVELDYSASYDC